MKRNKENGSALMVVLVVIACVTTYAVANSVLLHHLKAELRMIEKQQEKKFTKP